MSDLPSSATDCKVGHPAPGTPPPAARLVNIHALFFNFPEPGVWAVELLDPAVQSVPIDLAALGQLFRRPGAAPASQDVPAPARPTDPGVRDVIFAPDFAVVVWYGAMYSFSSKQRSVVATLAAAREQQLHWVSGTRLLNAADSDGGKLRDLFRKHPAWGTMIIPAVKNGGPVGCYRLAPPPGKGRAPGVDEKDDYIADGAGLKAFAAGGSWAKRNGSPRLPKQG